MTETSAPDAAVQIVASALCGVTQQGRARDVVAALARAGMLCEPAEVAAMRAVVDAASDLVMHAVHYAGLVGKYIRMERPATEVEKNLDRNDTVGMECTVAIVQDGPDSSVLICGDEGYQFAVRDGEGWRFWIWPDEQTRKTFR